MMTPLFRKAALALMASVLAPGLHAAPNEASAFSERQFYAGPEWLLRALANPVVSFSRVETSYDRSGDSIEATYLGTLRNENLDPNGFSVSTRFGGPSAGIVPNATNAVIEWANVGTTFSTGATAPLGAAPVDFFSPLPEPELSGCTFFELSR